MGKEKILITGITRGIGRSLALHLSQAGYDVTGTHQSFEVVEDKIDGVAYIPLDLENNESISSCIRQAGEVDILINNAGGSQIGPLEETDQRKIEDFFLVNLFGPIKMIRAVLPQMRKKRKGLIINIGSLAAKFSPPYQSLYSAAKSALAGMSWSLRHEVKNFGIRVVVLEPKDIRTSIQPETISTANEDYQAALSKFISIREVNMARAPEPDIVAKKVKKIIESKKSSPFYTVGGLGPFQVFLKRLLPNKIVEKMVRNHYKLK